MTDAPKIDTQAPERIWAQPEHTDDPAYGGFWIKSKVAPSVEYIRADVAAAQAAAAWIAGRDAAADDAERHWEHQPKREGEMMQAIAENIRDLQPPADTTALDRLIAERVREAVEAEREACARAAAVVDFWAAAAVRGRARGSKEGSPTTPDEQRIRQDERNAIAAYIGMSPSEVTDRQYHMEAIRTGRYRDDPLMQRGGWMEGGDG